MYCCLSWPWPLKKDISHLKKSFLVKQKFDFEFIWMFAITLQLICQIFYCTFALIKGILRYSEGTPRPRLQNLSGPKILHNSQTRRHNVNPMHVLLCVNLRVFVLCLLFPLLLTSRTIDLLCQEYLAPAGMEYQTNNPAFNK